MIGTGTPGDIVHITLTNSQGNQAFGLAIVNSNSKWSTTVNTQAQHLLSGEVVITATQADENGNDSPVSNSVSVTNSYIDNTPGSIIGGGDPSTGVYVLNNRNAVDFIGASLGHVATAILTSNGQVYFCSFNASNGNFSPGKWDQAPTNYAPNTYIFPSMSNFRSWLNSGTTGYSLSNVVYFAPGSTGAQNAENEAAYLRSNTPEYEAPFTDCQTITDNILGAAGFNVNYFTSPIPNTEVDDMEYIINNSGQAGGTKGYDSQWVNMAMYNPSTDTYYE